MGSFKFEWSYFKDQTVLMLTDAVHKRLEERPLDYIHYW